MSDVETEGDSPEKIFYTVEAPGVLRSNANYNVIVTIFEATETCEVKISLQGGEYEDEKIISVQPMSSEMCVFEIPALTYKAEYYLKAEGLKGISFQDSCKLRFKEGKPLVYIQCDKQAYKRGDHLDYRVCFLDQEELKPVSIEKQITVKFNFFDDIIFVQNECTLRHGLYTGQWKIPDDIDPGFYFIEVFVENNFLATKDFEIIDYSPPKFEIHINTVKELLYTDKQFGVNIEAHYYNGSPVIGTCKMELETVAGYFSGVYIEKSMPIDGTTSETIVDIVDDLDIQNSFVEYDWFTTATVMVKATITPENSTESESLTTIVTVKQKESSVDASYEGCGNSCILKEKIPEQEEDTPIQISILKENVRVGDTFNFTIALHKPAKSVVYFIIARGNIVKSELIEIDDSTQRIERMVEATFKFVPRAFILAYFIHEDILYFDEVGFNLAREFENQVDVVIAEKEEPGSEISIQIKSSPHSLIVLMAVDENSVLLKAKNDLKYEQFFNDLYYVRSKTSMLKGCGKYPGLMPGLLTFTNATIDGYEIATEDSEFSNFFDKEHFKIESQMPCVDTDVRKNEIIRANQEKNQIFGNWLFIEKETDDNGLIEFETILPKTPAIWLLTVFSLSMDKGFAMTKKPVRICTKGLTPSMEQIENPVIVNVRSKMIEFVVDHYEIEESKNTIIIDPPVNSEPVEIIFTLTENLFGSTIADLSDYAGVMYCTGHLHMTNMFPNIVVLEYLEEINQLDSNFAISIKERFPKAIKRELAERLEEDGSFRWFVSDSSGSPHVTSLVMQAFQRAAKYVEINSEDIERGLEYLASNQLETGEFKMEEHPYKYPFEKNYGVGLTSMVLLAFLQTEHVKEKYAEIIDKAFEYIVANIVSINCVYDQALAFYAMQIAKHSYAETLKKHLFEIAKRDALKKHMWWTYTLVPNPDPEFYQPINDVELTSYILLGLLETESIEILLPIVKWLLPLRNCGNETMDRAIGLNAVLKMATKCGAALGILNVEYIAYGLENEYSGKITLTPENSSRIQSHVLPKHTQRVKFSTKDIGTFFGQVCYRYKEL